MASIEVAIWMFVVSQIFGVINIGISFYKFQIKNKEKTLRLSAVSNVFKALSYGFLLNWSLAGLKVVSIVKNLVFSKTSKPDSKIKLWQSICLFVFFTLISASVVFVTWWYSRLWFEWVILFAVVLANFGKWMKGMHILRITAVFYRAVMIINSIFFFLNPTNLIKAVAVIISIIVFYIRLIIEKRQKKVEAEPENELTVDGVCSKNVP